MKKLVTFAVIYFATYAGLAFKAYTDQGDIDKILADPVYVEAEIIERRTNSRLKKGIEIKEIDITYKFSADGKEITGLYSLPESSFASIVGDKPEIAVVFKSGDPSISMPKSKVEGYTSNGTFTQKLFKLLIFALIVALIPYCIIAMALGWMKAK
jgi:hypothetical protein